MYVVWALPFALWMLVGYVRAVPAALEEAASVDGAGRLRTLVSVTAPLLVPGIVVTALFAFITAWNEYDQVDTDHSAARTALGMGGSDTLP